jgi:hypothetical protein
MKTILFLTLLLMPASLLAASFKVVETKGSPFYRPAGSLKKATFSKGAALEPGGRIKMANGDFVKLTTPMGDSIELSGSTYIKLDQLDSTKGATKVSLELFKGLATNKVAKLGKESSFSIRTPSAVAGVRGTEFQVAVSESGETEVAVMEGEVGVSDADGTSEPVPVTAGKSAKVNKSGGVSVKTVSNIKKQAQNRSTNAAKGKQAGSTQSGDAVSTSDAPSTDSSDTNEVDETEDVIDTEEVDTEEITEAISAEVDDVVDEVNKEIQDAIDEASNDGHSQVDNINVELESIER